nr:MAG TPA: hypothetical protein [Caudoviricetes sp.]
MIFKHFFTTFLIFKSCKTCSISRFNTYQVPINEYRYLISTYLNINFI